MSVKKHIIVYPFPLWGHARPLINLAARLVKLGPVHLTLLGTNKLFDRMMKELSRSFDANDNTARTNIRLVSLGAVVPFGGPESDKAFELCWRSILSEKELVCAHTGKHYSGWKKPCAIIVDLVHFSLQKTIRTMGGNSVKMIVFTPSMLSASMYLTMPDHLGGRGNLATKIQQTMRITGKSYPEVSKELLTPTGREIHIPGLPPMYDYELHPQDTYSPVETNFVIIYPNLYQFLEGADGNIIFTSSAYEPEAVAAVKSWFAKTGRTAYACGPLLPSASKVAADAAEKAQSKESDEIETFLDNILRTSGKQTLLYISLGSIFWPKKAENIWAFLDIVMELGIPFIFAHAGCPMPVPEEVKEKVIAYGKGMLSPWVPQQLILEHGATGWFVTHGGHNSTTETICAGVPPIFWPCDSDQPVNAAYMTDILQAGYELIEVRTGFGLKPMLRSGRTPIATLDAIRAEARDVLKRAFGEDGARKREKVQALQRAVLGEWQEGGGSRADMVAFLESLDLWAIWSATGSDKNEGEDELKVTDVHTRRDDDGVRTPTRGLARY